MQPRITTAWSPSAARWFASHAGELSVNVPVPVQVSRRALTWAVRSAVRRSLSLVPPARATLGRSESLGEERPPQPSGYLVDVAILSDDEMHVLNAEYRSKDRPTDVISFAFDDEGQDGGPDFAAMFPGAPHALGEISISIESAARQAGERGHGVMEEIAFLAVHGTLHLLGYDHDTAARRRTMWAQQARVMAALAPLIS